MRIPLPERGQPLDVDYLYQMANQINSLTNQIASTSSTLSTIDNAINGRKDNTTNNLRFVAKTKSIKVGNVSAGVAEPWFIDFSPDFLYVPVATATPVNNTLSTAGNNVTIVIKSITTSRVDGTILYNSSGTVDLNINVIAIGFS
jgi:hypothetical protein